MNSAMNYRTDGGREWVIGGKLTFKPGAIVEGAEWLLDQPTGDQVPFIADSEASTVAALREDYNRLLAALRKAGIMASE